MNELKKMKAILLALSLSATISGCASSKNTQYTYIEETTSNKIFDPGEQIINLFFEVNSSDIETFVMDMPVGYKKIKSSSVMRDFPYGKIYFFHVTATNKEPVKVRPRFDKNGNASYDDAGEVISIEKSLKR